MNNAGTMTFIGDTFSGNSSIYHGGAIANGANMTIINSTLYGNTAVNSIADGGGIFTDFGMTTIINSNISNNTAGKSGGGIFSTNATTTLDNTIVANNTATSTGNDIMGSIQDASSYNLISNGLGITNLQDFITQYRNVYVRGNIVGNDASAGGYYTSPINPNLGPLQNNGGPTATMALLLGSPAIGTGNVTLAVDQNGVSLTTDQRGTGYPRTSNGYVDIGAYKFTPLAQTVTFGTLANQTYGVAPITLNATDTSSLPIIYNVISGPATVSGNTLTITGAGTVTVAASAAGNATYNPATPVDESFTVAQATAAVNVTPISNLVYNGKAQETARYSAIGVNGILPSSDFTDTTVHTGAAGYSDTWTFTDPNYATQTGTVTDTIARATPTFSNLVVQAWPNQPSQYIPYGTNQIEFSGVLRVVGSNPALVPSSPFTVSIDSTASWLGAGSDGSFSGALPLVPVKSAGSTYTMTYNYAGDPNLTPAYATQTLTVTQVPLTVTGNSASMVYGGVIPIFTTSILPSGVTETTSIVDPVYTSGNLNAGTYTLDTVLGGPGLGNYNSTIVDGTLTVTPATATVTANPASSVYGSPVVLNGVTYSGLVNGETPANLTQQAGVQTNATSSSNVGLYGITVTAAVDANYAFTYVPGGYSITPAALTIIANSASGKYGTTPVLNGVTYSGFVGNDNSSNLTVLPTVTTTATSNSSVGAYTITASSAVDPNYTITYVPGTYVVTKADSTKLITVTGYNVTYDGDSHTVLL